MPRDPQQFPLDDRLRIQHMLDAARHVALFIKERSRSDLDSDPMLVRVLMNAVQEIGEAAARIGEASRDRAADVPWGQIVAMRHILVHVIGASIAIVCGRPQRRMSRYSSRHSKRPPPIGR